MSPPSINTRVLRLDPDIPDARCIAEAAKLLQQGQLVAFPTETVYGLGANALDAEAVSRIFVAKGRPAINPIIVHVFDRKGLRKVVAEIPPLAERLIAHFWPGPLSLVLNKHKKLPGEVTAQGPTVAVRSPASRIARDLIAQAGLPIAAPSANLSSHLSPTRAQHVLKDLAGRIPLILDGGKTRGGVESTVINLTVTPPLLLRPGLISPQEIENLIGPIDQHLSSDQPAQALPSPGMLLRHYAPHAVLQLVSTPSITSTLRELLKKSLRVAYLYWTDLPAFSNPKLHLQKMPDNPSACAACLFDTLHHLDDAAFDYIVVQEVPKGDEWLAIRDRLIRASSSKEKAV